jgi:hypothetical protein
VKPILRVIAGRPIPEIKSRAPRPAPAPLSRHAAANAPMVVRHEEEKPADAVEFMDRFRLAVLAGAVLLGIWLIVVLVQSLERVAS